MEWDRINMQFLNKCHPRMKLIVIYITYKLLLSFIVNKENLEF